MDENVQNTEMQDAIPAEQETQQELVEENATATAPDEQESTEAEATRDEGADVTTVPESEGNAAEAAAPFLSVQYNHEDRPLSREETVDFVQIGMHHKELHQKLDYAASLSGTDVNTLIDRLIKAPEEAHRKHLEEMYGEDATEDIEIGMEIFRRKQAAGYDQMVADRAAAQKAQVEEKEKSTQSRLAEEYIELKREIPDAPEYAGLPDSVIVEAASGKRNLLDAYLRFKNREQINVTAAQNVQQEAAKASTGSMGSDAGDNLSSFDKGFLEGLWG